MQTVTFSNGKSVTFDKPPTQRDIEEVANRLGIKPPPNPNTPEALRKGKNGAEGFFTGLGQQGWKIARNASSLGLATMDQTAGRVVNLLSGKGFTPTNTLEDARNSENGVLGEKFGAYTTPQTPAEKSGALTTEIASYFAPSSAVTKSQGAITGAVNSIPATTRTAQFARGTLGVIGRALPEAASAGTAAYLNTGDTEEAKNMAIGAGALSTAFGSAGALVRGARELPITKTILSKTSGIPKGAIEEVAVKGVDATATPEGSLAAARNAVKTMREKLTKSWDESLPTIIQENTGRRMGLNSTQAEDLTTVINEFGLDKALIPQNLQNVSALEAINLMKALNEVKGAAATISPKGAQLRRLRQDVRELALKTFGGDKGSLNALWSTYSQKKGVMDSVDNIVRAFISNRPISDVTAKNRLMAIYDENKVEYLNAIRALEKELGVDITGQVASTKFQTRLPEGILKANGGLPTKASLLNQLVDVLAYPITSPKVVGQYVSGGKSGPVSARLFGNYDNMAPTSMPASTKPTMNPSTNIPTANTQKGVSATGGAVDNATSLLAQPVGAQLPKGSQSVSSGNDTTLLDKAKNAGRSFLDDMKSDSRGVINPKVIANDINSKLFPKEKPKDLMALHNLNEENLEKVFQGGGLPAPSIAITKNNVKFNDFGQITLVGNPKLIDPKKADVRAFGGDVYTVRIPTPEYDIKTTSEIARILDGTGLKIDSADLYLLRGMSKQDFLRKYEYLNAPNLEKIADRIYGKPYIALKNTNPTGELADLLKTPRIAKAFREASDFDGFWTEITNWEDAYPALNSLANKKGFEDLWPLEEILQKQYETRLPYTVDNMVKKMEQRVQRNSGSLRGTEAGWGTMAGPHVYGFKEFKSLDDVRASKNNLLNKEVVEEMATKRESKLNTFVESKKDGIKAMFGDMNANFEEVVRANKYHDTAFIKKQFGITDDKLATQLGNEIKKAYYQVPTQYFEAKVFRNVKLHEFDGAVVPHRTSPEIIKKLEDAGIKVVKYNGDVEDRLKKIAQFTGSAFGIMVLVDSNK